MNATATMNAAEWEAAWEQYVETLERWEANKRDLYRPRHVRRVKRILTEYVQAKQRLRKLDSEFCDRMGIN